MKTARMFLQSPQDLLLLYNLLRGALVKVPSPRLPPLVRTRTSPYCHRRLRSAMKTWHAVTNVIKPLQVPPVLQICSVTGNMISPTTRSQHSNASTKIARRNLVAQTIAISTFRARTHHLLPCNRGGVKLRSGEGRLRMTLGVRLLPQNLCEETGVPVWRI